MEFVILMVLLALVALVGLGCFLLALAVAVKLVFPREEESAAQTGEDQAAFKKPDPMDEGFENIMGYSVMGETGFGDGEN